jgi:hypothetical protein
MGKENPTHIYASLHVTVTTTTHVQVHKLFFFKVLTQKMDLFLQDGT